MKKIIEYIKNREFETSIVFIGIVLFINLLFIFFLDKSLIIKNIPIIILIYGNLISFYIYSRIMNKLIGNDKNTRIKELETQVAKLIEQKIELLDQIEEKDKKIKKMHTNT